MKQRIAVMGCGAIGTIFGAYLTRAGLDVTMIDVWKEHVEVLNKDGASITGGAEFNQPVRACLPEEMTGTYDIFIYLTKQTFNDTAIPQMIAHCGKDTLICTGQNGLPEYQLSKFWPEEKIFGCTIGFSARMCKPGTVEITMKENDPSFKICVGAMNGRQKSDADKLADIFRNITGEQTLTTDHLMQDRWSKIFINATYSGMSVLVNGSFADGVSDERRRRIASRIGREVVRVCHSQGFCIPPIFGNQLDQVFDFNDAEGEKAAMELAFRMCDGKNGKASMLQDLEKGRRCEISSINGVVSETGRKFGVPTPFCDALVKIVTEIESGKRKLGCENIDDMPSTDW